MTDRFLRVNTGAEFLDCSKSTFRRFIKEGKFPGYRIGGRLCVKESDLNAFVESQRLPATPGASGLMSAVSKYIERARARRAS
jgi:excisionase family DNA binding protein